MEEAPPVPPKDTRYTTTTMAAESSAAHGSTSKRKRDALDITSFDENAEDEHMPKRRCSPPPQNDIDADASEDATPAYQKNVRRKKGSRNLSHLNLRHAAGLHKDKDATIKSRKSKFIEGSMNDKPSDKPSSMFMRFIRTDSGNIKQVAREDLMQEYHDSNSEPRDSVDTVIALEKAAIPGRVAEIEADKENKNEGITFGKWASSFHPVALWNKVFAQTREDIIREDFDEAERKAKEKANYEAQYQAMKQAGMFKPKPIGNIYTSVSSRTSGRAPRDSVIAMDDESDATDSLEKSRSTCRNEISRAASQMSGVLPNVLDDTTSASEAPETGSKPAKTLKSRLHLKKPSLTNISGTLKRAKSDFSLAQTFQHRESSSSISPVKADFENPGLKKSQSRYDLKKQNKLSKRVSDLESKLSQARKELDEALTEASPMPKYGNKYERFTPQSTLKRPKFVPGQLPSLPSERILMAQQNGEKKIDEPKVKAIGDVSDIDAKDANLREFLAEAQVSNLGREDEDDGVETIKARGPQTRRQYPTRASSLFSLGNNNIEQQAIDSTETEQQAEPTIIQGKHKGSSDLTEVTSSQIDDMDPQSTTTCTNNTEAGQKAPAEYASRDAKLKALDANAKITAKAKKPVTKTKKRKSGADEMDESYKPGKTTEEATTEDEDQTPKKKRKSIPAVNSSPKTKEPSKPGLRRSPKGKKAIQTSPSKKAATEATFTETAPVEEYSAGEGTNGDEAEAEAPSTRTSFDSQGRPLDPVLEEAEEEEAGQVGGTTTTNIPLNDEPSKPTAMATPARHAALSVNGHRSRSASPTKQLAAGAEEKMITRAAEAAKRHPARARGRNNSPLPPVGPKITVTGEYSMSGADDDDEPIRAVPGEDGVPAMPNGKVQGKEGRMNADGAFEWPDDVF